VDDDEFQYLDDHERLDVDDDEFLRLFETLELPAIHFHHREHVRLAWIYLSRHAALEALQRFTASLKAFVAHHGAERKYHETVTWGFLLLIHERMHGAPEGQTWEQFAATHPDLLDWKNNVLRRYYRAETLDSERARAAFVLPDRSLPDS
jgi:hypothetical protein